MRRTSFRFAALAIVVTMIAAGCGKDRESSASSTTATTSAASTTVAATNTSPATTPASAGDTTTPPTEPAPQIPTFGDGPWPCSAADSPNADTGAEVGVTADSVTIAIGDDAGYSGSPGLNKEMTDAMKAFIAKCNELGGIHGRQINM